MTFEIYSKKIPINNIDSVRNIKRIRETLGLSIPSYSVARQLKQINMYARLRQRSLEDQKVIFSIIIFHFVYLQVIS